MPNPTQLPPPDVPGPGATSNLEQVLLDSISDGLYYVDQSRQIRLWNQSAEKITGYTFAEVAGRSCSDNTLCHINDQGEELCLHGCPLSRTLEDGKQRSAMVYLHHKQGFRVPVSVRVSPVLNDKNEIIGAVETFTDLTRKIDLIQELETLRSENLTDALTGTGNRRYADYELKRRFEDLTAAGIEFGLLFLDVDHFKTVNDRYGHGVGDKALKLISKTVFNITRSLDSVCRWGGDEFIVILPNAAPESLGAIAEKIRTFVEKTWLTAGSETIRMTLSMGATMARKDDTAETLISRADRLMYRSKQDGRNRVTLE